LVPAIENSPVSGSEEANTIGSPAAVVPVGAAVVPVGAAVVPVGAAVVPAVSVGAHAAKNRATATYIAAAEDFEARILPPMSVLAGRPGSSDCKRL
jgi:hypothetical protein